MIARMDLGEHVVLKDDTFPPSCACKLILHPVLCFRG